MEKDYLDYDPNLYSNTTFLEAESVVEVWDCPSCFTRLGHFLEDCPNPECPSKKS
jgi:hypothetical protein